MCHVAVPCRVAFINKVSRARALFAHSRSFLPFFPLPFLRTLRRRWTVVAAAAACPPRACAIVLDADARFHESRGEKARAARLSISRLGRALREALSRAYPPRIIPRALPRGSRVRVVIDR